MTSMKVLQLAGQIDDLSDDDLQDLKDMVDRMFSERDLTPSMVQYY